MVLFSSKDIVFLKVHCGGVQRDELLHCALDNNSSYFGRGIIRCDNEMHLGSLTENLDDLGYKYTYVSEKEADGMLRLPEKFVKTFIVEWYEKEIRAWAKYKRGGYG